MRHIPHLFVEGQWDDETLNLTDGQQHHLKRVLKSRPGDAVTYTDGEGRLGRGTLSEDVSIVRGDEEKLREPTRLDLAVAPPTSRDRARFLVEKLGELGVTRLIWLRTTYGANRAPSSSKTGAWARSALEQSRGAWLMKVDDELSSWSDLEGPVLACDPGGSPDPQAQPRTVAIGPEGGWADAEIPDEIATWALSSNVLRVETAAIVAGARILTRTVG